MNLKRVITPAAYFIIALITASVVISCGKNDDNAQKKDKKEKTDTNLSAPSTDPVSSSPGKEIFYMKSEQNNIACADCHSDGTNNANTLTKYFSNIQGANKRTSTYHGMFTGEEVVKNAGGATVCWKEYLRMKTPLTDEQISALNDYYGSVAGTNPPEEIKYETIALPKKDKAKLKEAQNAILALKGDPAKGEKDFENSCGFCHSESSKIRKVPEILEDFDGNVKSVTFNVKFGDGAMPFFKDEVLSDQEIADIAAYILQKSGK